MTLAPSPPLPEDLHPPGHAARLVHHERLELFASLVRSRLGRRIADAERARRQMTPLPGVAGPGWESLEAAAALHLREGDAFAARSGWSGPASPARRIGDACRLTEMVSAGLGATIGCRPGSLVIAFVGPAWSASESSALEVAVSRRAPLVVLFAGPAEARSRARTVALGSGAVAIETDAGDAEVAATIVGTACEAARAGKGPTLVTFRAGADPLAEQARSLARSGVSRSEIRELIRLASRAG